MSAPKGAIKARPAEVMQIWDPRGAPTCDHREIYEALLPLAESEILELGCGKAEAENSNKGVAARH